jgi:hypothetical protein
LTNRLGWGCAIKRKDGSEFLAVAGNGLLPAVWANAYRSYAVAHKRQLIQEGFKARVVRVRFSYPEIEPESP